MPAKSASTKISPHKFLAGLVGHWSGTAKTWADAESEPVAARVMGTVQSILEGRFILFLYQSAAGEQTEHGMYTLGFDTAKERYQASWVDSYHTNTGILYMSGEAQVDGFALESTTEDPSGGPDLNWRTEIGQADPDHLSINIYSVNADGVESQVSRTSLARIK